jgi:hypothetical protein
VLAHHGAGPGGGLGDADLGGRAVKLDLLVERGLVGVRGRADDVGDQLLHRYERVSGLAGPAPVGVRRLGIGDGGQLAQRVGTAELMFDIGVGVVGRPRVVHRDPAEPAQDPGVVDALGAALGVAGDQRVLVGAGAVHPGQPAGHPQPGLVEPGHRRAGDALAHHV